MIPIFAKIVAKGRHWNALHVTFICAQVACTSILAILMPLSSHLFFFYFNMSHCYLMWHAYNVL